MTHGGIEVLHVGPIGGYQQMTATNGWNFVAPPGWPSPPPDWVPPADWQPDPSWPAAPVGWQFWQAASPPTTPGGPNPHVERGDFHLWGSTGLWCNQEVAGESHHLDEIRTLVPAQQRAVGAELDRTAALLPEPKNKYDVNAIRVIVDGHLLGYLPRDVAPHYAPRLSELVADGWRPVTAARIWAHDFETTEWKHGRPRQHTETNARVLVALAEPHMITPLNAPPAVSYRMLPLGNAIQVAGEEHHLQTLVHLLPQEGEGWVLATLHKIVTKTPRTSKTVLEVRIGDDPVGTLTPHMSSELMPAVDFLNERGATAAARAVIKGNRIKVEVTLHVARAHELGNGWFDKPIIAGGTPDGSSGFERS